MALVGIRVIAPGWSTRIRLLAAIALTATLCGCRMWSQNQNCSGVALYQQGQYQQAFANFQQAVQSDPTNADAVYNLAAAWHVQAKQTNDQRAYVQAEQLYNRCLDLNKDHVDCHRGLAVLLVETNRQDKALNLMKNWSISSPNVAASRVELARLYEEIGDKQSAATWLNQALAVNPYDARALAAMGKMREEQGDVAQAIDNYRRAYAANPAAATAAGVTERLAVLTRSTTPTPVAAPPATAPTFTAPAGTRLVTPQPAIPRY
jgi:tetratricopeptide (TPR) repeat protein